MRTSGDWKTLLDESVSGLIRIYRELAATVADAGFSLTCTEDQFLHELGQELLNGRASADAEIEKIRNVASIRATLLLQEEHRTNE